jgi:HemK-like putative methylase
MWDWLTQQQANTGLKWQDLQLLWQHLKGHKEQLETACAQLKAGKPLEYLINKAFFGPLTLEICSPLLIPRAETWDWIEQFLPTIKPKHVLDLGCGPGTLGMALAYFHPEMLELTCIDNNPLALTQAAKNLKNQPFLKQSYLLSNWLESLNEHTLFDLVLCNPPYCAEEERSWMQTQDEDERALFAKFGGLQAYQLILKDIFNFLTLDGIVIFEHGASQGYALTQLLKYVKVTHWQRWYDASGAWRATSFRNPL